LSQFSSFKSAEEPETSTARQFSAPFRLLGSSGFHLSEIFKTFLRILGFVIKLGFLSQKFIGGAVAEIILAPLVGGWSPKRISCQILV